jgi:hypothetical protein
VQVAAVAAGAAGAFFAYKRWMAYRQELEDEQAASGYYVSAAGKEQESNADEESDKVLGKKPATKQKPKTETSAAAPLPGGVHDVDNWLERAELLIGKPGMIALSKAHVLVVGLGGVGSFAAEFLARAGIGELTIIDGDDVDPTNRNRQLPALVSTQRRLKAQVMKERLLDINPALKVHERVQFVECHECLQLVEEGRFDYVVDCIDSLQAKHALLLLYYCFTTVYYFFTTSFTWLTRALPAAEASSTQGRARMRHAYCQLYGCRRQDRPRENNSVRHF